VTEAHVHIEGHTAAPDAWMAALKARCEHDGSPVPVLNFMRHRGTGVHCFPIDEPGRRLGWLLLKVDDDEALRPYVPFLGNIAGNLGRILCARHVQQRLASANEELREARDGLEQRVAERTRELEYRATHDQLTGLANRALLIDRLRGAKLDLVTGVFAGAEALVRWEHPRRGLLPPSHFIPLAEDSALIVALGERVLLQACLQARIWRESGLGDKTVAVNLAARQLRDGRIVDTVRQALQTTGLMPSRLELEITESSIMHDIGHATALPHELKALGVAISIDDFGTGYSSLSVLRNLPADKLKIDRSFIHEIETVPSAAAVVLAVISFARALGMRVIAEGVETAGQAAFLQRHGCDEIQGYLMARPLPSEQLLECFRRPAAMPWKDSPQD
jgi:EAL domain-containing protein (putative c-di-GMP-specific phosphodiesterase class I)